MRDGGGGGGGLGCCCCCCCSRLSSLFSSCPTAPLFFAKVARNLPRSWLEIFHQSGPEPSAFLAWNFSCQAQNLPRSCSFFRRDPGPSKSPAGGWPPLPPALFSEPSAFLAFETFRVPGTCKNFQSLPFLKPSAFLGLVKIFRALQILKPSAFLGLVKIFRALIF